MQILKALYSLPRKYRGKQVRFRADSQTVRFYEGADVFRVVPRQPRGGRHTDPADFPPEQLASAKRDTAFLLRRACDEGEAIGQMAVKMLDCPLPWTRMRHVYKLISLSKKYGKERLDAVCVTALGADIADVYKLERTLRLAAVESNEPQTNNVIPMARYLRPSKHFALPAPQDEQQ